jgi:predicted solute-binding protein
LEHFIVSVLNILSQKKVLSVILMQNIKLRDSCGSQAVLERVQALLSLVEASQEDLAGHLNLD